MVSTSITPATTLDCFCKSHRPTQQCGSHDFFVPMLALIGILTILLTYTEIRGVLRRMLEHVVYHSSTHCSWVDLYCKSRTSHSANVFSSIIHVIWKTIYASFTFAVPLCILVLYNKAVKKNHLENRCRKYQQQCEAWIDYRILRLFLLENHVEFPYRSDEKLPIESLWDCFNSFDKDDGFKTFITCLESSLQNLSYYHLGHYSLQKLLTNETENILECDEYICNLKIQEIIKVNICRFIELINVQELLPVMDSKRLLTNHDKELLNLKFYTYTDKADHLLTKLLPTKGHCGYNLFLDCLEDEHSHTGHCEIVEKIKTELHKHQIRRPPKCSHSLKEIQMWYQPGLMNTQKYIEAMEIFMYLGQSNDVRKFYSEIKDFVFSHNAIPEVEAFALMMKVLSLKYRCKDSKVRSLIHQTNQCINRIENDNNKRDIKGHWYLILSCWYRHQGNFQKSRAYLEQTKPELICSNNRAHVLYNEASLQIESTTSSTISEDKKCITLLEDAIRGFHSNCKTDSINIMQARCYLQVAHCYIGSSLNSCRIVRRSSVDLHKADSILTMLTRQLDVLPLRIQMHYYTVMSDYHRVHNRRQQAIDCKHKGLSLDTSNQFKRDQKYLQDRFRN